MIILKNISKTYRPKGQTVAALNNVSFSLGNRGMYFIIGKSGCGKSTLLNILGGLDTYEKGEMIVEGKSTENYDEKDFDKYRNDYIGFVFQDYLLIEDLNVEKNVALALQIQGKKGKEVVKNMLNAVGLNGYGKRKITELSGGQRQRVAIARALIKNPKMILADEPTGNLDSVTSKQIFDLLKNISRQKLVVIVSHDIESAQRYADFVVKLVDGKVAALKRLR